MKITVEIPGEILEDRGRGTIKDGLDNVLTEHWPLYNDAMKAGVLPEIEVKRERKPRTPKVTE